MKHLLMKNNITELDKKEMINFIKNSDVFTQSKKVKEFDEEHGIKRTQGYHIFKCNYDYP